MVLIAIVVASVTGIIITVPAKTARATIGIHRIITAATTAAATAAARVVVAASGLRNESKNAMGVHASVESVGAKGGEE